MARLAPLLALPLTACATAFGSGPFPLAVDSSPQGAIVSYMGHDCGVTPCTIAVGNDVREVQLRLDGHHPRTAHLLHESNLNWLCVTLLTWGPIGLLYDLRHATRTDASPILVPMVRVDQPAPSDHVRTRLHREPVWRRSDDGPR
jgi:hypothetical protein